MMSLETFNLNRAFRLFIIILFRQNVAYYRRRLIYSKMAFQIFGNVVEEMGPIITSVTGSISPTSAPLAPGPSGHVVTVKVAPKNPQGLTHILHLTKLWVSRLQDLKTIPFEKF